MSRNSNTTTVGRTFSQATIDAVWNKGKVVPGVAPSGQRKDTCEAWMKKSLYGITTENGMGWEIDHIKPIAQGGTDDLNNLQPLQWQNNRGKGDNYPNWSCAVNATN